MLLPTFIPTPVLITTVVGLVITPLQQTHPSVFLLSPSTHLHRHKHGITLATVSHLKETVTMVGVLYIIYLILCFQKQRREESLSRAQKARLRRESFGLQDQPHRGTRKDHSLLLPWKDDQLGTVLLQYLFLPTDQSSHQHSC